MSIGNPNDADRVERVRVDQYGSAKYKERVVEDSVAARRTLTSQLTGLVWLLFGALECLLALRVILKLVAANPNNPFAALIYTLSEFFVWPFVGLTITPSVAGIVIEIHTFIAMLVYAIIGWILVNLIWLVLYRRTERSVIIEQGQHRT